MGTPNWARLVRQGRAKAVGIPWNDEELHALYQLGIPVDYVRSGILTQEEYKAAKNEDTTKGRPLERLTSEELLVEARALGIDATLGTPKEVLIQFILQKGGKERPKAPATEREGREAPKAETPKEETPEEVDLSKLKKDELIALALEKGLEVDGLKKEELVALLKEHE